MQFPGIIIAHTLNPKAGITSAARRVWISLFVSQAAQVGLLATLSMIGNRQSGPGYESPPPGANAGSDLWVWEAESADFVPQTEEIASRFANASRRDRTVEIAAMTEPESTAIESMISDTLAAALPLPIDAPTSDRQGLLPRRLNAIDSDPGERQTWFDPIPGLPRAPSTSAAVSAAVRSVDPPAAFESSAASAASSAASSHSPPGSDLAGTESIAAPRRELNAEPDYPMELLARGVEGVVKVRVDVSATGQVTRAVIDRSSGHRQFDDAAIAAVRTWRFDPAFRNGRPTASTVVVPVRFRIDRQSARP